MRAVVLLLSLVGLMSAAGVLDIFGRQWTVREPSDWKVDASATPPVLHLAASRGPLPGPRRPIQFALTDAPKGDNVTIEADVRPLGRSLMIVFAYQDEAHFDYAHLSVDTGVQQPFHNGIFHVYDGERVRISSPDGPPAFAASGRWYHAQLEYDSRSGEVHVSVDGHPVPALHAVDMSLGPGKVGLGSFDETADFKNVVIR